MGVKEDLKRKVPERVKSTPEWHVFLHWLKENRVRTADELKSRVADEIGRYEELLKKRQKDMRLGTNMRLVRSYAYRLSFLKLCRDKICKYV